MGNSVTIMNNGGFIFEEWYIGAYIINNFIPNKIRPHSGPEIKMTRTSIINSNIVCVITIPEGSKTTTNKWNTYKGKSIKYKNGSKVLLCNRKWYICYVDGNITKVYL